MNTAESINDTIHTSRSTYREAVIEHVFLGDILRYLWNKKIYSVEVLKSEVDDSGYDIILEYNGMMRHIQLKSSFHGSSTQSVKIHTKLQNKPAGCVIWIIFEKDTLNFVEFLWYGGSTQTRLPDISQFPVAKHTKANALGQRTERPDIRVVTRTKFVKLADIAAVAYKLFDLV